MVQFFIFFIWLKNADAQDGSGSVEVAPSAVRAKTKQKRGKKVESCSSKIPEVEGSTHAPSIISASPPWEVERREQSTPVLDSLSDQIDESQYILSPRLSLLRQETQLVHDIPHSEPYKPSENVQPLPTDRLNPTSAYPSQDMPSMKRALARGETASVTGVGDEAFRAVWSQENRLLGEYDQAASSSVTVNDFDPEDSQDVPKHAGLCRVESRFLSCSNFVDDEYSGKEQADPVDSSILTKEISWKTLPIGNSLTIPNAQSSYPGLSSISKLPNQARAQSISSPIMESVILDEGTSSDGTTDSEDEQLDVPGVRRAGTGVEYVKKKSRGLFDYFKLR